MIDIKKLKENPEFYKNVIKQKNHKFNFSKWDDFNFDETNSEKLIDFIIYHHNNYLRLSRDIQLLREQLNKISSSFNSLKDDKERKNAINLISKIKNDLDLIKNKKIKMDNHEVSFPNYLYSIENLLSYFPNSPLDIVPIGKDENENVVLSNHLNDLKIVHNTPHWEVLESNNLIMKKESSFLSGPRHVIYNDKAAKVIKAIELFMLEENDNNGYEQKDTPVFVNEQALFNTAQLPKMRDDLYRLDNETEYDEIIDDSKYSYMFGNQYLIPTAEVTLTNLAANKIYKENELPKKFTASTLCFRKEAGAAGKDTRGIIRLHQFRKVELVKIVHPNNKTEELNKMLKDVSSLLDKLKLPYRIVQLCTGDLSFGSEITYDLEVWFPSISNYREISSISSMGDFQARRMQAKLNNGDKNIFVNTLNGSGLAIDRTFAAIIENYYNEDTKKVLVPEVLQKYLKFSEF